MRIPRSGHFRGWMFALALPLTMSVPGPLPAQDVARADSGLRARMSEFLSVVWEHRASDTTRTFFPTSGDWSYTRTVHPRNGDARIERWIIPAAQTSRLFGFGPSAVGGLRESFEVNYEGQKVGLLINVIGHSSNEKWQFVGQTRFVPPFLPVSSPTFVEWRKEGDRWVISSFGDEWFQAYETSPKYLTGRGTSMGPVRLRQQLPRAS
jgi:hypothetical protein